jgi:hypothetical protein
MPELKVTLKQHTPLIHFQHDQEGATLRASEVKPKLDKFVKTKLKELDPQLWSKHESLIDSIPDEKNKDNSPYKLSIQMKDEMAIDKYVIGSFIPKYKAEDYRRQGLRILDKTPYFADNKPIKDGLSDEDGHKLGIMPKEGNTLELTFRFWEPKWKNFLQEVIPMFFAVTNFGTRQDKGFGCFYPADMNQQELEKWLIKYSCNTLYRYSLSRTFDLSEVFKVIDTFYKTLKSGGQNTESELWQYFRNMKPAIEWEKPTIQENIQKISCPSIKINPNLENRQFVRALLGLPELYEYPKNGMKVLVQSKSDIERYASPISFKIFERNVYLFVNQQISEITSKTFGFDFNSKDIKYGELALLNTPEYFNVVDFLNNAMKFYKRWMKIETEIATKIESESKTEFKSRLKFRSK